MVKLIKKTIRRDKIEPRIIQKYLTFYLAKEEFAVDILKVQEIKSIDSIVITSITDAPAHIAGIMKYNNTIIPIINLRQFFHLPAEEPSEFNAIIIFNIKQSFFAIIVDYVSEIIELTVEKIKNPPDFFSVIKKDFVEGIADEDDKLAIILNIDKLMASNDLLVMGTMKPLSDKHE